MSGIGMSENDEYHLLKHLKLDYFSYVESKNQELEKEIEQLKTYIRKYDKCIRCNFCGEEWNAFLDSVNEDSFFWYLDSVCLGYYKSCTNCRKTKRVFLCKWCGTRFC